MVKVDIIYGGNIYAPNGASVLMKKIEDAKDLFLKEDISQRLITPYSRNGEYGDYQGSQTIKVSRIKKIVRQVSKHSLIISYIRYRRNLIRPAERAISIYDEIQDKGDVLVFHEKWTCYSFLKKHNEILSQKVILVIHGDWDFWGSFELDMPIFRSFLFKSYKEKFKTLIESRCDLIGFDAKLPMQLYCKAYNYNTEKAFFVYNGIDFRPSPNRKPEDKLKIICVATLSDRKNQMGLLNSVGMLSEEEQEKTEVILVGDGPTRGALENKAKQLVAKVYFAGTMKEKEYYDLLVQSNCFCLYSKEEGLPIAVVEGLRAALPVIGSRVGGIPEEIKEGVSGFVVDLEDKQLAERIKWMIYHMDQLPHMGASSYQLFLDNYTTEAMVRKYVEVYNGYRV